jgi:hypothetical protein
VRLRREAFDKILAAAVHSSYVSEVYGERSEWTRAVARSDVRLQWDPDHGPSGDKLERRAIQLGLRDETLRRYAREWIVGIEDVSEFVEQQRLKLASRAKAELITPREDVYPVADSAVAAKLGVFDSNERDVSGSRRMLLNPRGDRGA